ncbi:acyltransferase domain-containing protein [Streptomyces sp. TRM68416]|uniref:acyltransferase domain-containing protein n=1 Tax=Streptomyces sp. TRM68416 TaxID=2758412 RepID=UPI001661EE9B|nr:acyltransferase domain-containing protein [Streptomyces sp. TRM68416]MBD0838224.1 acyltransferase domain-containing protein [Streptomyces sp. TRM68416]
MTPLALLLPGAGAQYPAMGYGLYRHEPAFTSAMDDVLGLLGDDGERLYRLWASGAQLRTMDEVHPLLFAVCHALSETVRDRGLRPGAVLGQSVGELVAAVQTGVLALSDAVRLVVVQAEALAGAPAGGALAVAAGPGPVVPCLRAGVVVAACNGPGQTVVSGGEFGLRATQRELEKAGLTWMRVQVPAGLHGPLVADACRGTWPDFRAVAFGVPRTPLLSGRAGGRLSAELAVDPEFWALQPSEPVLLDAAMGQLGADGPVFCAEVGPGHGLAVQVRRHGHRAVSLLDGRAGGSVYEERERLREALDCLVRGESGVRNGEREGERERAGEGAAKVARLRPRGEGAR